MSVKSQLGDLSILVTGVSSTAIIASAGNTGDSSNDLVASIAGPMLVTAFTALVWFFKHTYERMLETQKKQGEKLDLLHRDMNGLSVTMAAFKEQLSGYARQK